MSGHLSHRLTNIHRAVSIALLYSVGYAALVSSAQAAMIGKTVVTSAQHEPLVASIAVSDIRAADFSASLANSTIYQQMGLTQTDSMSVRFQPTSATSGQVVITTSQPVSKPFADVVLTLNDKGKNNVVPKTLLMPLNDNAPIKAAKNTVTGAQKPNLPSVSASISEPLTVRKGAPPPLISAPTVSTSELVASRLPAPSMQLPTIIDTASQGNNLAYAPSRLDNGRLGNSVEINNTNTNDNKPNSASRLDTGRLSADNNVTTIGANNTDINDNKDTSITALADKKFDILNIQITRQIQPSSKPGNSIMTAVPMAPASNGNKANVSTPDLDTSNNIATATPTNNIPANIAAPASANTSVANNDSDNTATSTTAAQYQVQRNDSLWVIAQQIAQENDLDVQTVMKQIQSQNPDAFINKDADQLKADAKLSLPSYDVVPSQQKLEAAISAQRQYNRRANTPTVKKTAKAPAKKTAEKSQAATQRKKPMITKTQTLPKAQFSVLAPGRNGSADGTQEKSASTTGNGLSTDVLATLKASRENAALQAERLSKTSSALDSYTKKIQLQNQKLAELQARLKKLRNQ
ncbi:peptigoglycan-binding protein LysM [Psychrobacter sp. NZS113]|uniref:type IV pilus assembly protein FimV n=1 Tax=Psychrobacter sp. NZS113 TaxID=2792045 RepID=UPI0018CE8848|nr:peptigoglycan-binding protein LysM [Psychrobacter sp. NZS113]MBH0096105.1 peptigoglycan-binding protein LysM [Psychrobacter sp. NZS113]